MTGRHAILLVEDDPDDEELTLRALKRSPGPYEIVVVHDGEEALAYLFGSDDVTGRPRYLPHVVLLDLKLPKLSGLDVLKRVRADPGTQLLPIVILTSSSEEDDILNAYRLGANSFVRKPVECQHFDEVVRGLGNYWSSINQPCAPVVIAARKVHLPGLESQGVGQGRAD
jgi:two-component system, response regulator